MKPRLNTKFFALMVFFFFSLSSAVFADKVMIYQDNFTGTCINWTGATCTNSTYGGYYGTSSANVNIVSPNLNLSAYAIFEIIDTIWIGDYGSAASNMKIAPLSSNTSTGSPRAIIFNLSSTFLKVQNESGYADLTLQYPKNQNVTWNWVVNRSSNTSRLILSYTNGTVIANVTTALAGLNTGNFSRFETGPQLIDKFYILDRTVYDLNGTISGGGNDSNCSGDGSGLIANFTFPNSAQNFTGAEEIGNGFIGRNTTGVMVTPNLSLSNYSAYRFIVKFQVNRTTYAKLQFRSNSGGSGDNFFLDNTSGGGFAYKFEPNYTTILSSIPYMSNITITVDVNRTSDKANSTIFWTNGTHNGSASSVNYTFSDTAGNDFGALNIQNGISKPIRIFSWVAYDLAPATSCNGSGNSSGNSSESGWVLRKTYNFTAGDNGFSGHNHNASGWIQLNSTSGTITSPNLNLTGYTVYRLVVTYAMNRTGNAKVRYNTQSGTLENYNYLIEAASGQVKLKHEPPYTPEISGAPYNANITLTIDVNKTSGKTNASMNWSGSSDEIGDFNISYTSGDYVRIEIATGTGYFRVEDFAVYEYVTNGSGSGGGSSLHSILNASESVFASENRSLNHKRLIDAWYAPGFNVTQTFTIGSTTYLWVPKYASDSACNIGTLDNCDGNIASPSMTNNCLVTDQFSQVGMVLAQGDNQTRFDQWVNTLNLLDSPHGQLPVWKAMRSGSTVTAVYTNTASDADGRIATALYMAVKNPLFADQSKKDIYKELGDNISADILAEEYVNASYRSRTAPGQNVTYWLAGGWGQASGGALNALNSSEFTYAGYFGDMVIWALAAYNSTGDVTYLAVAGNTTLNYLDSTNWTGASFRVAPPRFRWLNNTGTPYAVCSGAGCPGDWDDADAPRAVTMCKALYYYNLTTNGAAPSGIWANLSTYCRQWTSQSGYTNITYARMYYNNGTAKGGAIEGYFANALGSSLSFYNNQSNVRSQLDQGMVRQSGGGSDVYFNTTTNSYQVGSTTESCMGVYGQFFGTVTLGSGIGRDMTTFGST